ncbi:L-fuconolactonase [Paraburkholderia diazotrophica]|uniref:L-fuconolactonase n=1 Tax=Paraburkholderia diazotrophica TaxID=667676 RepID=A0A1H6VVN8_9BURK|nr:L-fuconolactonase [Paraburkholderia diazotrophica]
MTFGIDAHDWLAWCEACGGRFLGREAQPRMFGSSAFHFYRIDRPSGHRVAQS